jgi:hypothetical protein
MGTFFMQTYQKLHFQKHNYEKKKKEKKKGKHRSQLKAKANIFNSYTT